MQQRSQELRSSLGANGLSILGHFSLKDDEILLPNAAIQPKVIAIVGNVGSSIWPAFTAARHGQPELTLDRWTKAVLDDIAVTTDARALYPFEGPPFWPFIQWAVRTGSLFSSPIGLTIHPVFGLWHAFRGALLFDQDPGLETTASASPCASCMDRPCLNTCPVSAFSDQGYDFEACLGYLDAGPNPCRSGGCEARKSCPIGKSHHYLAEHAAFHMNQLLQAHGKG